LVIVQQVKKKSHPKVKKNGGKKIIFFPKALWEILDSPPSPSPLQTSGEV
jgi:hypothetical protein